MKARAAARVSRTAGVVVKNRSARLFLPGALLVPIQAQLLAPFVFVDFSLAAFFQ
jgi:hypothetical protein